MAKIVKLNISNFKRLVAVEITPDGNMITITGKNGAGKSSVLDSIAAGLGGKKIAPLKPIRDGETSAQIVLKTEDFTVKRTFTEKGSSLVITSSNGYKAPSPQAILDRMVGAISFDPLAYSKQKPAEQRALLMDLLKLSFNDLDERLHDVKVRRSTVNTEKERLQHEAERIAQTPNLPGEEINIKELGDKLAAAFASNATVDADIERAAAMQANVKSLEEKIAGLKVQIAEYELAKKNYLTEYEACIKTADDLIDTEAIQTEIAAVDVKNEAIRNNQQKQILEAKAKSQGIIFSELGQDMKKIEKERAERMAEVKMPIAGLEIMPDCVAYEGIPLGQVNSAKALEICLAICAKMNPEMRVMLINGNDCDTETLAAIAKAADKNDVQVWVERASDGEPIGIVIEDGMIKEY